MSMRLSSVIGSGLLAVALAAPQAQAASAVVPACAVYEDCGQWANTTQFPPFTLFNNIWGTGAGSQCLWACSGTNMGVWADHPATSGVKSYPNIGRNGFQHQIDSMPSVTSSFNISVPSSGWAGTASYDIWQGGQIEIMLWMNQFGGHGPWARAWDASGAAVPDATNINVGGHTWNVYFNGQPQGSQQVWSFIRTSNTSSGTVDIRAILQWLRTGLGSISIPNVVIDNYQFGFEISQSPGGQNYTVNSYSLNVGGATSTPTARPRVTPTPTTRPTATPTTRPTATPTARPRVTPTATPRSTPTPRATPTPTTGGGTCANPTTLTMPITIEGPGDFCRFTTGNIAYVNSWALTTLTINGVDYNGRWSNSLPARVNGGYYVRYVGTFGWSHFEAR